jgi:hypothetical protein
MIGLVVVYKLKAIFEMYTPQLGDAFRLRNDYDYLEGMER